MKIGVVLSTNDPETIWNAFRFGNTALNAKHKVKVFLMNKGVEVEDIEDERYDINEQINSYTQNNGQILACGTCLKSRQKLGTELCPISTMTDLLKLIEESDKILTFG